MCLYGEILGKIVYKNVDSRGERSGFMSIDHSKDTLQLPYLCPWTNIKRSLLLSEDHINQTRCLISRNAASTSTNQAWRLPSCSLLFTPSQQSSHFIVSTILERDTLSALFSEAYSRLPVMRYALGHSRIHAMS